MIARLFVIERSKGGDGGKTWEIETALSGGLASGRATLEETRKLTVSKLRLAEYRRTAVVSEGER